MSTPTAHQTENCRIFAHRGASQEAMENTRAAFDKALAYTIDGIETDVQLSRDEVPVLWHDPFLDKMGLPESHIDDFNYHQLSTLKFSECKSENILSLQTFLDNYRHRCRLLIEVKNREWESIYRHEIKMRQTLDRIGPIHNQSIIVSSFNLDSLVYAHHCRPSFPLMYNVKSEQTITDVAHILNMQRFLYGFCLPIEILNQAMVDLLREHGKCIAVYTCNSDEEINKALHSGADILITDYPDKALKLRDT